MRGLRINIALLLGLVLCGCGARDYEGRPNIVLILIDSQRADHLGIYGYERPTSPTIDALAADGHVYEQYIATASQTVPTTLSMMLSQFPAEHGIRHAYTGFFSENRPHFPDSMLFLAEVLSKAGYNTAGYMGCPFLVAENGFAQGFDEFIYTEGHDEELTMPAIKWIKKHANKKKPFFVYMHYFDVHWPYDPPPGYKGRFPVPPGGKLVYANGPMKNVAANDLATTIAAYDEEIVYVDNQIKQLLETLDSLGERNHTIIVVTADHGEEFLDHGGLGHGTTVYSELVRIPLIMVYPPALEPGKRITHLTRQIDLAPTLLELANIEQPPEFLGQTLDEAGETFSEDCAWRGVYAGDRKLVVNDMTGAEELYDTADTLDQHQLAEKATTEKLLGRIDQYRQLRRLSAETMTKAWSKEESEKLRSLGYAR